MRIGTLCNLLLIEINVVVQLLLLHQPCGEKEVVRELENDQRVSLEANVSRSPFIFFDLSGFSIFLITTRLFRGLFA